MQFIKSFCNEDRERILLISSHDLPTMTSERLIDKWYHIDKTHTVREVDDLTREQIIQENNRIQKDQEAKHERQVQEPSYKNRHYDFINENKIGLVGSRGANLQAEK
jgi:hypothetical protein